MLDRVHYQITLRGNMKFTPKYEVLDENNPILVLPEYGCDTSHVEELKSQRASWRLLNLNEPSTLLG